MEDPVLFGFMKDDNESYLVGFRNHVGEYTPDIIFFLGIINLVCSGAIVFFFLVQRSPLIFTHHWYDFPPKSRGFLWCYLIYTIIKKCI